MLDNHPTLPEPDEEPIPPATEIGELVQQGRFCEAARLYSSWSGTNYLDSKLVIDRLARKHGLAPHSGCASYFMMLVVGLGSAVWWCIDWLPLAS